MCKREKGREGKGKQEGWMGMIGSWIGRKEGTAAASFSSLRTIHSHPLDFTHKGERLHILLMPLLLLEERHRANSVYSYIYWLLIMVLDV